MNLNFIWSYFIIWLYDTNLYQISIPSNRLFDFLRSIIRRQRTRTWQFVEDIILIISKSMLKLIKKKSERERYRKEVSKFDITQMHSSQLIMVWIIVTFNYCNTYGHYKLLCIVIRNIHINWYNLPEILRT